MFGLNSKSQNVLFVTWISIFYMLSLFMISDIRRRRHEAPKPPPYSEAPPDYHTIHETGPLESPRTGRDIQVNTLSEHVSPRYARDSYDRRSFHPLSSDIREHSNTNAAVLFPSRRQNSPRRASPPSYISVAQIESRATHAQTLDSPVPGTSTDLDLPRNLFTSNQALSERRSKQNGGRFRQASPNPSLASGRISELNSLPESSSLQRTISDRTSGRLESRSLIRRTTSINIGISESVSPVPDPEVLHGRELCENSQASQGNLKGKSRIPRPVVPKPLEIQEENMHHSRFSKRTVGQTVSVQVSAQTSAAKYEELFSGDADWPKTPPLISAAAAERSAQRKAVLERLKSRRQMNDENGILKKTTTSSANHIP